MFSIKQNDCNGRYTCRYVHVVHNARVHNAGVIRYEIRPGREFFREPAAVMNNSTRGLLINRTAISLFIFISLILSETIIYGRTFVLLRYKRKSRSFWFFYYYFFLFMFIPLKRDSRIYLHLSPPSCDCSWRQFDRGPRDLYYLYHVAVRPTTVRRRDFSTTKIKIVRFCADGFAGRSKTRVRCDTLGRDLRRMRSGMFYFWPFQRFCKKKKF